VSRVYRAVAGFKEPGPGAERVSPGEVFDEERFGVAATKIFLQTGKVHLMRRFVVVEPPPLPPSAGLAPPAPNLAVGQEIGEERLTPLECRVLLSRGWLREVPHVND
jgi:hypothetical protein